MNSQTAPGAAQDAGTRAACLQRLATALSAYPDLSVTVRAEGPAPCLAARNMTTPHLSETIAVTRLGDQLAYLWSWEERIGDASDPDSAAHAIAYVLHARGAQLGGTA
jgi:hypothetical protein